MSFAEFIVILIVAILVINPKHAPEIAKAAGRVVAYLQSLRAQATQYWHQLSLEQQLLENEKKAKQAEDNTN